MPRRSAGDGREHGVAAVDVVRALRARLAVAAHHRPVRDPRQRGDAAADTGRPGDPAVSRLARALAVRERARRRLGRRRDSGVAGARLQPARARTAARSSGSRARRLAGGSTTLPGIGPYTAAAVRNFAFGEDVLPHDVNVDRIERRTRHRFTGAAAQALMDLGATVCLARVPRCEACPLADVCPSRGSRDEAARKQRPVRGLVPPAACCHPAPRGCRRGASGGARPGGRERSREGRSRRDLPGRHGDPPVAPPRPARKMRSAGHALEQRNRLRRQSLATTREAEEIGRRGTHVDNAVADAERAR